LARIVTARRDGVPSVRENFHRRERGSMRRSCTLACAAVVALCLVGAHGARAGSFLNVRYVHSDDWLDGEFAYKTLEGVYARSFTVRDGDSLSLIVGGADLRSGELSFAEDFELGGIRTFPGLRPGELRGNAYWFAGTAYYWRLFDMLPLFGNALYAGLRVQAGRMEQRIDAAPDDTLPGLSGSVGGRTPLGPFVVSVGYVDNGSWQLQFSIGRPVSEGSMLDELY
jgi:hypothetical protein